MNNPPVSETDFSAEFGSLFAHDNPWTRRQNIARFAALSGQFVRTVQLWTNGHSIPAPSLREPILTEAKSFFKEVA